MSMSRKPRAAAAIVAVGIALCFAFAGGAAAQTDADKGAKSRRAAATTQARPQARTRIRVYPAYPRRYELSRFPPPDPSEYRFPGPNAVRECVAWLAPQYRSSGTVIVPHTRCWWQRG